VPSAWGSSTARAPYHQMRDDIRTIDSPDRPPERRVVLAEIRGDSAYASAFLDAQHRPPLPTGVCLADSRRNWDLWTRTAGHRRSHAAAAVKNNVGRVRAFILGVGASPQAQICTGMTETSEPVLYRHCRSRVDQFSVELSLHCWRPVCRCRLYRSTRVRCSARRVKFEAQAERRHLKAQLD